MQGDSAPSHVGRARVTGSPTGPERTSVCHAVRVAVPAPGFGG